jgi:antitoxin ParD1/3/4
MTTVTISLREEDQRFIASAMKSGKYVSESEAVAAGIAELRLREEVGQARLATLRAEIEVGIEEADRGEFVAFDAEQVIADRRQKLAQL